MNWIGIAVATALALGFILFVCLIAGAIFFLMSREESPKEKAYREWYESLPLHEQYRIDQENTKSAAAGWLLWRR